MSFSPQKERRTIRLAGAATNVDNATDPHIITHLPSTVTTRRNHSPTKRRSAQDLRREEASGSSEHADSKFFHASEISEATRTPATGTNRPAFFTANSFSNSPSTPSVAPELRRGASALEVRARSDSRPTLGRKTPRLRDLSPDRIVQTISKVKGSQEDHAILSLRTHTARPTTNRDEPSQARSIGRSANRLQRQASAITLNPAGAIPTSRRSSGNSIQTMRLMQEQDPPMSADSTEDDSSALRLRTQQGDKNTVVSPALVPISSPQSSTSTSTSYERSDDMEAQAQAQAQALQPVQVNRKIMDLEIRTTSLLAVNNQLEKQTRKQAMEMKELRKQLAHANKYPGIAQSATASDDYCAAESDEELADLKSDRDASNTSQKVALVLLQAASQVDRAISRALLLSDQLLEDAQKGLRYRPRESEIGIGVRRVLYEEVDDESLRDADDKSPDLRGSDTQQAGDISDLSLGQVLPNG